jgi:integrase
MIKRNQRWLYRRRIPADVQSLLGKSWWKISLGTGLDREVEMRARALAVEHDHFITESRRASASDNLVRLQTNVEAARASRTKKDTTVFRRKIESMIALEAQVRRELHERAERRVASLPERDRQVVETIGSVAALDDASLDLSWRGLDEANLIERQLNGERAKRYDDVLGKLGVLASDQPTISTGIEVWFRKRKQGNSAVGRHRVALRRFTEIHGDIHVTDITRAMIKSYLEAIENLADHRKIPTHLRGGMADPGSEVPRVSAPTVDRHLTSMKAFLSFCIEEGWVTLNVATGLKGPRDHRPKGSKRRSFSFEERCQLLVQAIEEFGFDGDMCWLIRLAAYSGARLDELAQLGRENIKQIDGVWVVEIDDLGGRHVKSQSSVRQIPIHQDIREHFVAWVDASKSRQVFAALTLGNRASLKLSGAFSRLMDRAGLVDPRLVFHSLRHTLKREMSNARIDQDVRRVILGHAGRTAHDNYDGHSLSALSCELDRLPMLFRADLIVVGTKS